MGKGMTVSELREFQRKQDEKWRNGQAYKKREEERRSKAQNISREAAATVRNIAATLVRQRSATQQRTQQQNPFANIGIYARENTGLGGSAPVLTEGKKQVTSSPDLDKTAEFQQLRKEFLKPYEQKYDQAKNEQDKANSEASKSRSGDMYGWDSLAAQKYEEARKDAPEQGSKVHKLLSEQIDRFNTGQEKANIASEKSAQAAKAKAQKDSAENAFDAAALQMDVENDPSFPAYVEKGTKEISKLKSYLEKSTGEKMVEIGLTNDDKLQAYLTINDNELNTYFALNGKYGETIANRYLDAITPDLEKRAAGMIYESVEGMEDGPAQKLARLGVTVAGAGQNVKRNLLNLEESLTGGEDVIAPGTMQKARSQISENLEGVEKVVNDIADSAVNMAPALAVSTIPGVGPYASAAMTGATSYSGNYSDAILSGYTPEQAASFAIPAAASESLMQYAIGGISKMGGSNSLTNTVKNAMNRVITNPTAQNVLGKVAQAGGEALEEYLQANVEPVLRNLALGENNEINPISEDKAYAALLGGIMGGGIDIATDVAGRTVRRSAQAEAKANEIIDRNGITRTYNPHETVRLANGTEVVVVSRDGGEYVIAEAGKSGYSRVAAEDIADKVRSTSPTADQYIPPERKVRQNEKYDARHVEKTADKVFLDKLTQGRGIKAVVEDMQPGAEAFYDRSTNTIHFAPDSTRAEVIGGVTAHELAHAAEGSPNYAKYSDYVMEKLFAGDSAALAQAIEAKQEQYISRGIDLSDADAAAEIVADYTRQLYKSEADIDALVTGNRSMAQSIYDSIKTAIRKIRAFFKGDSATLANIREYQELQRAQKLFERALSTRENVQAAAPAYAIETIPGTNKQFVKADRQVIKGDTPKKWAQSVENYINEEIRNGEDVQFTAADGDVLTITADTAGKAKFRNNIKMADGTFRKMTDEEFQAKLRAEAHIDELAQVSHRGKNIVPDYKNHSFAKDGFNYRTAYFEDADGQYYRITMSVGIDGDIKTIYNVGKMQKNTKLSLGAQRPERLDESRVKNSVFTDIIPQTGDDVNRKYSIKGENPLDIANLTKDAADTTPVIPLTEEKQADGRKSKFAGSVENSPYLEGDIKELINSDSDVKYYEGIANEDTLDTAYRKLKEGNREEVVRWLTNESKKVTAEDVAEGFILLKQYQDAGDYGSMISVARKLRKMGTQAGQTVQAFSILSRMTPEGMVKFAQAELDDAFEVLKERKSKNWLENNSSRFTLTDDEVQMITDNVLKASDLPEGRDKNILLAEISALIQNKLPSSTASKFRALQRISLLLNPKTNVRNILGNALMMPERIIADFVAAPIDRAISKKTGVRTTGVPNILDYGRGFKKGAYESYDDFRRGINTLNREGNRFEIGEAPAFNPEYAKTKAGKALTKAAAATDRLTSFVLEMGDRPFYEAYFVNSLNNQMKLANVTEPSADMIEIATQDALENTYQDNNGYTKFVEGVRRGMNFGKDFGFGNIVIPFAKTPANLTKALVEFSPVGLVKSITADAVKFNRAVNNGTATPQMQRKLVNNIGKGVAGTLVMLLGAFLAGEGIISGAGDDDKDAANFARNVLGIQPYSIVIGGKSYTYDWAAPVGPQFAIAADIVNNIKNGDTDNFGMDALGSGVNAILNALQTGGGVLFEQSFLRGIQDFFKEDNLMQALINSGLSVIGQYIPSLSNQIAQLADPVQRTTYAYNNVLQTGMNKAITRIPGLSQTLEPTVDVYGREVQRYGGDNNVFNVMVNPANVAAQNKLPAADEVWRLYQQTGDKTVFPSVAPYYIKYQDEKYDMSPEERTKYQKTMGQSTANVFGEISASDQYRTLTDAEKAELAKTVNEYSSTLAKKEYLHGKGVSYTPEKWIEAASKSKNPAAYIYYHVRNGALAQDAKREDRINLLFEAGVDENELVGLYSTEFEDKNTDERSTIAYAQEQGVRPSAFVEREIQKAGEHGMPGEPEEDAIWEDGKIVVDEHGTTVSGTKKAQVCDNLLNSGYTEKEKAFFYQKEYGTDGNFPYYAAAGLPVNDYLSVKGYTATLKADKDENGKSISGSKKEKLTEFLESSGMSEEQKLFFFAQNYKISGKEAQAVRDYIGGLNASDEVKEKLLESVQLGGGSGRKGSGGRKSGGTSKALQEKGAKLALKERLGPDVGTLPELDWDILTKGKSQQTSAAADTGVLPYYVQAMADVNKSIASRSKQTELENVDLSPWLVTAKQKANARRMIKNRYER